MYKIKIHIQTCEKENIKREKKKKKKRMSTKKTMYLCLCLREKEMEGERTFIYVLFCLATDLVQEKKIMVVPKFKDMDEKL